MRFFGNAEAFALLLEDTDFHGEWRDLPHVKQLRCPSGAIINFAPSTGRVWLQGTVTVEFERSVREMMETSSGAGEEPEQ